MRTYQHIIDTKALKATLNSIPDHWVVRDLSERDYGIDLMVEVFSENGEDRHKHKFYEATGRVCYLQVKGTNSKLLITKKDTVNFNIEKKALLYVEKFSTPFILVRVYTSEKKKAVFYCWLQRYILEVLDRKNPDWRESKQKSFSIHIPARNRLPKKSEKIERIAGRIKYIEEHAEFYEKYTLMKPGFEGMIKDEFTTKQFDLFINDLKRIKTLSTLLELNNCQVNQDDIQTLINYVSDIRDGNKKPISTEDFPLIFNLELLEGENFMRIATEEMIAENENGTVY
ncbi:DUF4365 domain-containing protein [Chryseobacterium sp. 18068]|uniref:DUF4365 domain-containing protein n=1 Tax=Chryseobacterium sp. 18068 TaxID=2681414 RepID=UPI001359C4B8|nr:DUF4365 domain-containing protein [Chryseobacterium sp. 18068]